MVDGQRPVRGLGVAHDQRRQDILEAVFAIVDEAGTDQVSVRQVADRADVSVGRVQHYFPTKDELLAAAFEAINRRGTERIQQRLALESAADPATTVGVLLDELVPRRPEDMRMFRIAGAFETYALRRPALREQVCAGYEELVRLVAALLAGRAGGADADAGADLPDDRTDRSIDQGRELLGLAVGLGGLVVNGSVGAADARRVVRARTAEVVDAVRDHRSGGT